MADTPPYQRVLLKLSGEALMGDREFGIDPAVLRQYAAEIRDVADLGVQMGIVIGGGNIYRGVTNSTDGIDKVTGDHMGMMATIINALALQSALEHEGLVTRLMSAIRMDVVAEPFIRRRAVRHLEKGRVVIFGAGSGMPFFSTDTVAAQRALEVGCEIILLAKQGVDGVYDADPRTNPNAKRYSDLTYDEYLAKDLKVADATAISLARDNNISMLVFNLDEPGNILRAVAGEPIGTFVHV